MTTDSGVMRLGGASEEEPVEGTRTQPVTLRGQETRARLLAAAEKVFGEESYFRVSIADITREAGVGNGTFYLYFPSKEDVFRELVEVRGHELRTVTRLATENAANRLAAEREAFAAFFDFIASHRSLYRIVRQAEFVDADVFRAFYLAMAEGYTAGLRAAMNRGEIEEADPEVVAYCLMGLGDFIGMRWVVWAGDKIPEQVFAHTMHFVEKALRNAAVKPPEGGGPAVEPGIAPMD